MFERVALYASLVGNIFTYVSYVLRRETYAFINQKRVQWSGQATPRTKNIVVVGASFAGYAAARNIARSLPPKSPYRVVVIEPHSHFHFTWVLPRFCVVKGHEHKAFIPYGKYIIAAEGVMQWIHDRVTVVNKASLLLENSGEEIPYDFLIIATGAAVENGLPSRVNHPEKADGMRMLQSVQTRIEEAKTIVVVGGGAAGVEVATDAKSKYPEKNVILVHSRAAVMQRFGTRLQKEALEALKKLGCEVILEERVIEEDSEKGSVTLKSGRVLQCDYFINCTGQKPTSHILTTLSPSSVSESGYIKVKPTLQIDNDAYPNIYACGDVTDTNVPTPNARTAMSQADVASDNVLLAAHGKRPSNTYKHRWVEGFIKLTLGLDRSVAWMGVGDSDIMFRGKEKKEELMAADAWKVFGQKPFVDESNVNEVDKTG